MAITLDDILRTNINFLLSDGSLYQNVWHHLRLGVGGFSDAVHITAMQSHFDTLYDGLANRVKSTVVAQLCTVDKVAFSDGKWQVTENIGTFTLSFTGSDAGEIYANQISPFIVFKTTRPRTVGRKFMFPFTEQYYLGSIIDGTLVTSLVAFAAAAMVDISIGALADLVVGVPRTVEDVWYSFTAAVVTNVCGTQRRRRPGVGA